MMPGSFMYPTAATSLQQQQKYATWVAPGAPAAVGGCPLVSMEDRAAEAIMCSAPFLATQAFIRRGLGVGSRGGAVDRSIASEPPVRFIYQDQFPGSRPPVAMSSFGPILPETLSPGLDNYLTSVLYSQAGARVGTGNAVPPEGTCHGFQGLEYGPAHANGQCKY
jgi:hypothetical protein